MPFSSTFLRFCIFIALSILLLCTGCDRPPDSTSPEPGPEAVFTIEQDQASEVLSVFRQGQEEPVVVQNAKNDFRPYLHPIRTPDGKSVVTEFSPGHHKHQTGLYWGFTRVNGRDYFHHPEGEYWQKVSAKALEPSGTEVKWQTVYHLIGEKGEPLLRETQTWTLREQEGHYLLDLMWSGKAEKDITIGQYDYGGLFLRMPWREGITGEVVNAARQRNEKAEGKRAMWIDVGMQVEGRQDLAHVAIFDHPANKGFPQTWRVDNQMGVGPVRARMGEWKINKGETEEIRHRLVVYTGKLNDVELTDRWGEYIGDKSLYSTVSLWGIAQEEGRTAKFLTPPEAVESMTLTDGFKVNAWASEPMITQPMAFCWDDRGRMWIAENRDYESRGSGFSNSGDSRILILEDTDRDGTADSRKVFLEGIPFPAAIAVGFGGVFIGAPPNLLFVPDRDGDDRADQEDIEVRLTGWGIRDRHETLNSFHWGPDGWLYGLEGFATPSKIRKPKGKGKLYRHREPFPKDLLEAEGIDINGGVWRYHPTKDRFEVVAHGFSNPWGIDYDAKGQLFITACVIPHLFHVVPGGIYHRQGGQHFNPFIYSDIRTIVDHRHRSAHGGARVYLSDAFPSEHYGRLFMANIHEHAVLTDILEPKGSGFVAHHGEDFLLANNAQWIGFSIEIGPEGAVYVLDWHDGDICGKEVLDKETGRIFRISPIQTLATEWEGRYADLNQMSDEQLVQLQLSASAWHARRARVILQYRSQQKSIAEKARTVLEEILSRHDNPDYRLRALWSRHVTGTLPSDELIRLLDDQDPYIRAWSVQLLCEDLAPPRAAIDKFANMARKDLSPVVRLYLAAALQRIETRSRWNIAQGLTTHSEDAEDHNIPKMIWFGIEPLVENQLDLALNLAVNSEIPLITQFIARRITDADSLHQLVAMIDQAPSAQQNLLEGMRAGLEGRTDIAAPANWASVFAKLQAEERLKPLALAVAQQFGDIRAARQSMITLKNQKAPLEDRRRALNSLATQQWALLTEELPALLDEPALRIDAIRAIAAYNEEHLGSLLLSKYKGFNSAQQLEALQTLASRHEYGWLLTEALKSGSISKRDVPAYVARQLRRVVGNGFVEVWGPIDQIAADIQKDFNKYRALLTEEALNRANAGRGRRIFQRSCGACHKMHGEGGNLGPDITGANRTNIDYLLSNMLDPSGEIQDDYKMVVITTRDGRTYAGNIAAESERQLTLRVVGQDSVIINKSTILGRETSEASMMPPGLLQTLSDQEVLDLVAYLRTPQQVELQ